MNGSKIVSESPTGSRQGNDSAETKSVGNSDNNNARELMIKEGPETSLKKPTVLQSHGYVIGQSIGTGSYATVKLAFSEKHQSHVAVKIISKKQAPADYLRKFLPREIEVVKGLRHKNIIRFLQAIETTHRVYIVMEYAENGNLLQTIRKESNIDEFRAKKWFKQLAEAIDYCHKSGVAHRDIKCENLLIDGESNIKLTDFGFTRKMPLQKSFLSETFCGSYAYASPEILKGIPYHPTFADIWSMGVVLFAMVFGRLPFDDSNYNVLLKQVQRKVRFPKLPVVSSLCKTLISQMLAPYRTRIPMTVILVDPWILAEAQITTDENLLDTVKIGDEIVPSENEATTTQHFTNEELITEVSPLLGNSPSITMINECTGELADITVTKESIQNINETEEESKLFDQQ